MVEPNDDSFNKIIDDGLDPNGGDYDKMLDSLDLPDSLEGDAKEWDPSKSQDFGPIPDDILTGFYQPPIDNKYRKRGPSRSLINVESEHKEQVDCADRVNRNDALQIGRSPEISGLLSPSPMSVLESSGASSDKSVPIGSETSIPVRARSKRERPSTKPGGPANANPWSQETPIACDVEKKSSNSIKGQKRRRLSELNQAENEVTSIQPSVGPKRCTHCDTTETPQWRMGPKGKNTLCNACGVRHRAGRLHQQYRPAASPTFNASVHSNMKRKVEEMRKDTTQEEDVLVDTPMASLAETVLMSSDLLDDDDGSMKVEQMGKDATQEDVLVDNPMASLAEAVPQSSDLLDDDDDGSMLEK